MWNSTSKVDHYTLIIAMKVVGANVCNTSPHGARENKILLDTFLTEAEVSLRKYK